MKKTLLGAAVAVALASGAAQAALIDFDGAGGATGVLDVAAVDWSQTSFLALGGQTAIGNFLSGAGPTTFDILTHATLATGVTLADGSNVNVAGLNAIGGYQITMVARFQETVTGVAGTTATFATTGVGGFLEIYFDDYAGASGNSVAVSGSGFNDGRLILRGTIIPTGLNGTFTVTGGPVQMDGAGVGSAANRDNYDPRVAGLVSAQQSVTGFGSNDNLLVGGLTQDATFFQNALASFGIDFENISLALPFGSVDPSDCFTGVSSLANSGLAVGAVGAAYGCNTSHTDAPYSGQLIAPGAGGIVPVVGPVNGLFGLGAPDFVAQTDFNGQFATADVPEPTTIALLGLGLVGMGVKLRRRG